LVALIEYEYRQRLSTSSKNKGFSLAIESNVLAISEKCHKNWMNSRVQPQKRIAKCYGDRVACPSQWHDIIAGIRFDDP